MTIDKQDFDLWIGRRAAVEFTVEGGGPAAAIAELRFAMAPVKGETAAVVKTLSGGGIATEDSGEDDLLVTVTLEGEDSAGLAAGYYHHQLELTSNGKSAPETPVATGTVTVHASS